MNEMAPKHTCKASADTYIKERFEAGQLTRADYESARTDKGSYSKDHTLMYWSTLEPAPSLLAHMQPIPARASGSSYGACGIRIDGNPEFIDAVLSRLKDLIDGENGQTRLELARSRVQAVTIKGETKEFNKAASNAEVCYIRLHERGIEAKIANAFCEGISKMAQRNAEQGELL